MAVVRHAYQNPAILVRGGDFNFPPLLGRVHGVEDQIEKHLHQLIADDHHPGQA